MSVNKHLFIVPNEGPFNVNGEVKGRRVFNIASHGLRNPYFLYRGAEEVVAADISPQQIYLNQLILAAIKNLKGYEFIPLFFIEPEKRFEQYGERLKADLPGDEGDYAQVARLVQQSREKLTDVQKAAILRTFYPWLMDGSYNKVGQRMQHDPVKLREGDVVDVLNGFPDGYFAMVDLSNVRDAELAKRNGGNGKVGDKGSNGAYVQWDRALAQAAHAKLAPGGLLRETHYMDRDEPPNLANLTRYWTDKFGGNAAVGITTPLITGRENRLCLEVRMEKH